jgi:hypothetical protein
MIVKKRANKKIRIDLTGPDGNAFCLMGYARRFCKQMGKDFGPIQNEMMSGDYENVVKVFDREFGSFVILER